MGFAAALAIALLSATPPATAAAARPLRPREPSAAAVPHARPGPDRVLAVVTLANGSRGVITHRSLRSAERFARGRRGRVAFCVAVGHRLLGLHRRATFPSASVVKAMLLVADLRLAHQQHRGLSGHERALLGPMIRVSDNQAAEAIYSIVGNARLFALGRAAHMRQLAVPHLFDTRVSPADQARFFLRLPHLVPSRFRGYALGLLSSVSRSQSWGIPRALRPRHFRVFFKGGWRAGLVHQVALIRRGPDQVGLAIMTDHDPSMGYGENTIEGIAHRLIRPVSHPRRPGGAKPDREQPHPELVPQEERPGPP